MVYYETMERVRENIAECHHYWIIEPPNGPTSRGRCRLCDGTKEFCNTYADSGWEVGVFPDLEEDPWPEINRLS